jgi:hypothetical protein
MKSNLDLLAKLEARIETNRETDREERKADQEDLKRVSGRLQTSEEERTSKKAGATSEQKEQS